MRVHLLVLKHRLRIRHPRPIELIFTPRLVNLPIDLVLLPSNRVQHRRHSKTIMVAHPKTANN